MKIHLELPKVQQGPSEMINGTIARRLRDLYLGFFSEHLVSDSCKKSLNQQIPIHCYILGFERFSKSGSHMGLKSAPSRLKQVVDIAMCTASFQFLHPMKAEDIDQPKHCVYNNK